MKFEEIIKLNIEERKKCLSSMTPEQKQLLFKEIQEDAKEREQRFLTNQTLLKKNEEELQEKMNELKEMGLNSIEELQEAIKKSEEEINNKIIEYTKVINDEPTEGV